jgi:hypothetical protein
MNCRPWRAYPSQNAAIGWYSSTRFASIQLRNAVKAILPKDAVKGILRRMPPIRAHASLQTSLDAQDEARHCF